MVGTQKLAQALGLSRQQVRTALKKLADSGEITTAATNRCTVVTICRWQAFQGGEKPAGAPHRKNIQKPQAKAPAAGGRAWELRR